MEDKFTEPIHSVKSTATNEAMTPNRRHSFPANGFSSISNSNKYEENYLIHYSPLKTIEEIISHPIECGYLLAYCESQYSSENIRFVVEVKRFVELIKRDISLAKSTLSYKQVDKITNLSDASNQTIEIPTKGKDLNFGKITDWTSVIVPRSTVTDHIAAIFDEFISENAISQICLPSQVLINTIHRIKNINRYTFQVFEEAILDPIKTLHRDVLPRFIVSEHYKRCVSKCSTIYPLPSLKEFTFQMPSKAKVLLWPDEKLTPENLRSVDWYTLLHDYILFGQFLKYSQSMINSENLLCAKLMAKYMCLWEAKGYPGQTNTFISLSCSSGHGQGAEATKRSQGQEITVNKAIFPDIAAGNISMYKEMKCPPDAENIAWTLFRYFILPDSVYEVSVSHRIRKDIMEKLANPHYNLFDKVILSVIGVLRSSYDNYVRSEYFKNLIPLIKAEKQKLEKDQSKRRNSVGSCLPFIK